MTDQEVFDGLKRGDKRAMAWLYRTKRDYFVGYFIKKYKISAEEATGLAHNALSALEAWAQSNPNRVFTAKPYTIWTIIGRNILLGEQRNADKLPIINWDDYTEFAQNTEGGENPFEIDDFEAALPMLMPYFDQMKEPCQTILTQYFWENKTDREISDFLNDSPTFKNRSEAAVKMKRLRCIDGLRILIFNHLK